MNRADAAQILAILSAPHGFTIEPDTMEIWYQAALERVDADEATTIAVRIVEADERFPTPARFNTVRDAIRRETYLAGRDGPPVEQPALPGVPTAVEERRGRLAEMRAHLAPLGKAGARGHDHHGPGPCPVCGGLAPDVYAQLDQAGRDRVDIVREQHKARHRS